MFSEQKTTYKRLLTFSPDDSDALAAACYNDTYKAALRANTDDVIARGGYGSPTLFINGDDMYFGNDRLPLVEARLKALMGNL